LRVFFVLFSFSFCVFGLAFSSVLPYNLYGCGGFPRLGFLWLLWLAFAVLVGFRLLSRRWFPRVFRRLLRLGAALRLVAPVALIFSFARRRVLSARPSRFSPSLPARSALVVRRLRVARRLWFLRLPLPARAVAWLLSCRRRVRLVSCLRLRRLGVSAASALVRGRRLRSLSGLAFRLSCFRAARARRFRLGLVLGLRVPARSRAVFASFPPRRLCRFNIVLLFRRYRRK
jgi:hypothetical protein